MYISTSKAPAGAACVLIHDDGFARFLENTLPHLNPSRPMAIAVIPERLGAPDYLTLEQIKSLVGDRNYRITTCTHMFKGLVPLSKTGRSEATEPDHETAIRRLSENRAFLDHHGLRWEVCIYARGDHDATIRKACASMFRAAMGVAPLPWIAPVPSWAAPRIALEALPGLRLPRSMRARAEHCLMRCARFASYTNHPLEYFVRWASLEKTLLVLFDHGVSHFRGFTWSDVFELLEEYHIPIIDLYEAIDRFGNRESVGDYVYASDPRAWGARPVSPWRIVACDGKDYSGECVGRTPLLLKAKRLWWQRRMM